MLIGNSSVVSESMRDNPLMRHYAAVYTMSMGVMLLLKLLRGIVFVKVSCVCACVFFHLGTKTGVCVCPYCFVTRAQIICL